MMIKRIEHYNSHDIFNGFEKLHQYAMSCLEHAQRTGTQQKDEAETAWKMLMELLGKDIWKIYNPYLESEEKEFYTVTRTCKDDMRAIFEDDKEMLDLIETITPTEMQWIATKLADDYIGQLYWESLGATVKEVVRRRK